MGFFSRAFLVFLMKESKKRRRTQSGKLIPKSRSQPVYLPGARPLTNPLHLVLSLQRQVVFWRRTLKINQVFNAAILDGTCNWMLDW